MPTTKLAWRVAGVPVKEFVLHPGLNRVGRSASNDIRVDDSSISSQHCELWLSDESLMVRDLASTNGVFVDGGRVAEAELKNGQLLRLGSVEFTLVNPPARVAIPAEALARPAPVVAEFLPDGRTRCCQNHTELAASFRCPQCGGHWCADCVRSLRRIGGQLMVFCGVCGGVAEVVVGAAEKRRLPKVVYWLDRMADSFRPRPKYPLRKPKE